MVSPHTGLFTDLYSLTMMQGVFLEHKNDTAVFDMFFRKRLDNNGYIIFTGLESFITRVLSIQFNEEDIAYLRSTELFKEDFLRYLKTFRFSGSIWAFKEGSVCFPLEPLIKIEAPIIEGLLIEGLILNTINFQSLVATKAARICFAAQGRPVIEMGMRRAQGPNGALSASRAAYIGGVTATSNLEAGKEIGIPTTGTMSHAWVMYHQDEYQAFESFSNIYPQHTSFLLDTYNTLDSGLPNAIKVGKKIHAQKRTFTVRLDSGDLEYLSKQVRKILDTEGLQSTKIIATNDLDEYIISQLMSSHAPIDMFGVGSRIIAGGESSILPGVYKLSEIHRTHTHEHIPLMKVSNNLEKSSLPASKKVLRFFRREKYVLDLIALETQEFTDHSSPIIGYHPFKEHLKKEIPPHLEYQSMLEPYVSKGTLLRTLPSLSEIRTHVTQSLNSLDPTFLRLINPHVYTVSISESLKEIRNKLLF